VTGDWSVIRDFAAQLTNASGSTATGRIRL
jgi:hypothetical protein